MRKATVAEDSGFFLRCIHFRTINPYMEIAPQTANMGIPTIFQEVGKDYIEIKYR